MPSHSRTTQSNGVSGSASTLRDVPLTMSLIMVVRAPCKAVRQANVSMTQQVTQYSPPLAPGGARR
jgi:hypothetical protein